MTNLNKLNIPTTYTSNWHYSILSEKLYSDLGQHNTYGIRLFSSNSIVLHDISTCKETVRNMVKIFNQYQLSPIHFKDVIEDMLLL